MKMFVACFTFVAFLVSANTQVKLSGPCPDVKVQEDLNLKKYMGNWYTQSTYPINGGSKVCYATYSNLKGNTLTYTDNLADGSKDSTPAKYLGGGKFWKQIPGVYSILATDYHNYTIRYDCRNDGDNHLTYIGIGTRNPKPCDEVVKAARDIIAEKKLPLEYLTVPMPKGCKV